MARSEQQEEQVAVLQRIASLLEELVIWTRVLGYPTIRETLETALDSDQKRCVYAAMDGTRGVEEIQELTGVNVRFISEWGQAWERLGIAIPSRTSPVKGRRQSVFDLRDFDIDVADVGV